MASKWSADGQEVENSARALLGEMNQFMSLENGTVTTRMGHYAFLADALYGLAKHHYAIDDDTIFREFENSIREQFKRDGKLSDPKRLMAEFDQRCQKLLAVQSSFILITSIGLRRGVPKFRIINGCAIKFHRELPKKYQKARSKFLEIKNPINVNAENDGYLFVVCRVKGINALTAFNAGLEALAIYRALCQLQFARRINVFGGPGMTPKYSSELAFRLGNIHTMHLENGSGATETMWHQDLPNFYKPTNVTRIDVVEKRMGQMLRKLNGAPDGYRKFCGRVLLAFAEALDTNDGEARFVKLWLCLELLTGADDAKRIIKRVSFFYAEQEISSAQLQALRAARNSHVHAGTKPARMDLKNFRLAEFVEHLLVFVISNHFKFTRESQWHDFMSTTTDVKSIDEQIERLRLVKKFTKASEVED